MRKVVKIVCFSLMYILFIASFFTNAIIGNPITVMVLGLLSLLIGIVELKQAGIMAKVYMAVSGILFLLAIVMLLLPDVPILIKGGLFK